MHTHTFLAPFNFQKTARYIGRYENAQTHAVSAERFCQVLADDDGYYLVEVTPQESNTVNARIVVGSATPARLQQLQHFVERTFGPCATLSEFYEFSQTDRRLANWTRDYCGLRLVGVHSLWECLSWSIIGQQVSVASAFAVRSRLARYCGATIAWQEHISKTFDSQLAVSYLANLSFSGGSSDGSDRRAVGGDCTVND